MFKKIKNWFLDILFPVLGLPQNIKINQTLFCSVCRARLAENKKICHRKAQYLLGAATSYADDIIRRLIWQLKYRGKTGNSAILAKLLNIYIGNCKLRIENFIIVPVPLSQKRMRERGYNQSELIAKIVSENFQLPLVSDAVSKIKDTPPQAEIDNWDQRKINLENCFAIAKPELVKDKNIILLDDVFTSGATLNEIARVLKNAGAKRLLGLVVAKAG